VRDGAEPFLADAAGLPFVVDDSAGKRTDDGEEDGPIARREAKARDTCRSLAQTSSDAALQADLDVTHPVRATQGCLLSPVVWAPLPTVRCHLDLTEKPHELCCQ